MAVANGLTLWSGAQRHDGPATDDRGRCCLARVRP